jgi:hypothetical protein
MVSSIGNRYGSYQPRQSCGPGRGREAQAPRSTATVRTRTEKESSSLKLTLRTDEGDTVEISLEAQNTRTSERGYARSGGASLSTRSDSQSSSLTGSVKVNGDLSDQEMADIQKLLSSLASGEAPEDNSSNSIDAYSYNYQKSREVTRTRVELLA